MRLLIEAGGEDLLLITETGCGFTALHGASVKGHVEVTRLLIGARGQRLPFLTDQHGRSPLHHAASKGHVNLLRLLVERGGKRLLAAKTTRGETAEDAATRAGHGALAGMLRRARGQGRVGRLGAGKALCVGGGGGAGGDEGGGRHGRAAGGGGEAGRCVGLGRWQRWWRGGEGPQGQVRVGQQEVKDCVACISIMDRASSLLVCQILLKAQAAAGVSWCVYSGHLPKTLRRSRSAQQ